MKAVFNISLPTSWDELTDKQLFMVYGLFARDLSSAEVKTLCLMKWNHLKLLATLPDKRSIMKKEGEQEVVLSVRQIQQATTVLDFLDSFPPMPVRIAQIGKHHALPADFEKARQRCMDMMRELFRQLMSVLILEQTKLQEHSIYLDPRISFQEIDRYFFSGCACAYFQIAVDTYTDLQYNSEEWTE